MTRDHDHGINMPSDDEKLRKIKDTDLGVSCPYCGGHFHSAELLSKIEHGWDIARANPPAASADFPHDEFIQWTMSPNAKSTAWEAARWAWNRAMQVKPHFIKMDPTTEQLQQSIATTEVTKQTMKDLALLRHQNHLLKLELHEIRRDTPLSKPDGVFLTREEFEKVKSTVDGSWNVIARAEALEILRAAEGRGK